MAAHDLITLTEAKTALHVDTTDDDDLLAATITAASEIIESHAGPGVIRAVTETHDGSGPSGEPRSTITLNLHPTDAVSSVHIAGSETSPTGYAHRRGAGQIVRLNGDWTTGVSNIVVAYTAGRFADTAGVSEAWKTACRGLVADLWELRQQGTRPLGGFDVNEAPITALPWWRSARILLRTEIDGQRFARGAGA